MAKSGNWIKIEKQGDEFMLSDSGCRCCEADIQFPPPGHRDDQAPLTKDDIESVEIYAREQLALCQELRGKMAVKFEPIFQDGIA